MALTRTRVLRAQLGRQQFQSSALATSVSTSTSEYNCPGLTRCSNADPFDAPDAQSQAIFVLGRLVPDGTSSSQLTWTKAICMIVWAIVSGCTAFVSNTGGLLAVRFFLGIVEAPFFPCAIYYLSCWYPKQELGKRMALLVSGIIVSNAFAGLLSAAILKGFTSVHALHTWSWLFIIEGSMTIVVATSALFLLPDYPNNTRWLSTEEKHIIQARLALDVGSADVLDEDKPGTWTSLLQAAKDHRVWLFACMQMATTASISYSHVSGRASFLLPVKGHMTFGPHRLTWRSSSQH